jgi:hypothetical protein
MKKILVKSTLLLALIAQFYFSQDPSGDWQGTLDAGAQKLRLVLKVAKNATGWTAKL